MSLRTKEIKLRLKEEELFMLNEKAKLCKCSREKFLRLVIFDIEPRIPPPMDYYKLIKEFNAIGNNLNQLAKMAYIQGINDTKIEDTLMRLNALIAVADKQIRSGEQ